MKKKRKGNTNPNGKSTQYEYDQRVETVAQMIVKLWSRRKIIQYVAEKTEWLVSDRQVDAYIADAKELIKGTEQDNLLERQLAKQQLDDLFQKNYQVQDFKEARAIIEAKAKLFGWGSAEKIEQKTELVESRVNLKKLSKEALEEIEKQLENED